jgi:hypothetical protein
MRKQLIAIQHSPDTRILVMYWKLANNDAGIDVSVVRSGNARQNLTFFNPSDVTAWFKSHSTANLAAWQKAYHESGLTGDSFQRPNTRAVGTYTVEDQTELWKVAKDRLGSAERWTEIWALNPDVHHADLVKGQVLNMPGASTFKPGASGDVLLDVPYHSQRDNKYHPSQTCNVTCYSMVLKYYGVPQKKPELQYEDELCRFMLAKGKSRYDHGHLAWMGGQYGLDAKFSTKRTWEQIRDEVRLGRPVIVAGKFTAAGHIIVIIGLDGDDFICNDPWGNAIKGYGTHKNGKQVLYPLAFMESKAKKAGGYKWGHFINRTV